LLVNVPATLFLGYTAQWFAEQGHCGAYFSLVLQVLCSYFLVRAATTNPGYLPKQVPPFEKGPAGAKARTDFSCDFKSSDVFSGGHLIKLKYCDTCLLYRPPRAVHCADCDVCVERFDHHCPWIGNCVARRNYRQFVGFVSSTLCLIAFDISYCSAQLAALADESDEDSSAQAFAYALERAPFAIVLILFGLSVSNRQAMCFVLVLLSFHLYLMSVNQTTAEQLKATWRKQGYNPYDRGSCWMNFKQVLLAFKGPSRFELRAEYSLGTVVSERHLAKQPSIAKTGPQTPEEKVLKH
jgi:palmitoyltransferase ZDHHC9/14/18